MLLSSGWVLQTLNATVDDEIAALPPDMQARFLRAGDLIELGGLAALPVKWIKHLEGKLWELRFDGRDGIGRALYVTATGRRVVVLRAFVKKSQATPARELALARQRMKELA